MQQLKEKFALADTERTKLKEIAMKNKELNEKLKVAYQKVQNDNVELR